MSVSQPGALYVAEPPAVWLQRPPVVADCSVLAALLWGEPTAQEAAAQLSGKAVHAPALLPYELASVASKKCRAGMDPAAVAAGLAEWADMRVVLHEVQPLGLLELAMRHGLSPYDAAYLALACELQAPLLTFDVRLGQAAARQLGAAG